MDPDESPAKKGKKIPWYQLSPPKTMIEKSKYVQSCTNWIMLKVAADAKESEIETYKQNINSPSSLITHIYPSANGFPKVETISFNNLPEASLIQLSSRSFSEMFPHSHVSTTCCFCQSKIPTMNIQHLYYEKSWPSPWFITCAACKIK